MGGLVASVVVVVVTVYGTPRRHMCVHVRVHVCVHGCACVHVRGCVHVLCVRVRVSMHVRVCVCAQHVVVGLTVCGTPRGHMRPVPAQSPDA